MTAPEFPNALPLDAEAWENALDDAWPREGGRSHIVRVLAREVVRILDANLTPQPTPGRCTCGAGAACSDGPS